MMIPDTWTFHNRDIAQGFDRHVREQLPWYELATDAIAHIARHYIPTMDGVVYDVGASTGNIGRALSKIIEERRANFIPIENSQEMAAKYAGPQGENLIIEDALKVDYQSFDLAILFLTLMFLPVSCRQNYINILKEKCKPGGAILIMDKVEPSSGYISTVLWRLTLSGKLNSGVEPQEIISKELSLSGVQRPLRLAELGSDAVEWFRFGDFAGWIIEPNDISR